MIEENKNIILKELFENPTTEFHIRGLARITHLNPNTILNLVKKLKKEDFIFSEKRVNSVMIKLNFENKKIILKKKLFNLTQLYNSGLIEEISEKYHPKSITLIGSYSKGEDTEKSDIDLVIQTNKQEKVNFDKFEEKLKRKIHFLILPKKYSKEFFNNLINGIVLYGVIEDERI